jgi:hypothetical protein
MNILRLFDNMVRYHFPISSEEVDFSDHASKSITHPPTSHSVTDSTYQHTFEFPLFQLSNHQKRIIYKLHNVYYREYPIIPCSQCCSLMYLRQVKWHTRNSDISYPITLHFHDRWPEPVCRPNDPSKIAFCGVCAKQDPATIGKPSKLDPIPSCLLAVDHSERKSMLTPFTLFAS